MAKQFSILLNAPQTVMHFVRESIDELKKVSWPDRQTTIRYTLIVVVASLAVGFIIGGLDYMFTMLLETLLQRL
jgi:preprotein translocase SecE subunit